jgi:hypothetical protein
MIMKLEETIKPVVVESMSMAVYGVVKRTIMSPGWVRYSALRGSDA